MFGKSSINKVKSAASGQARERHEENMARRSEYARTKMVAESPHVPFNSEHHEEVYIPKLHQPLAKKDGEPQSVRIGFGCGGGDVDPEALRSAGMSVGQLPVWGKKKPPVATSDDILVGGILVPVKAVQSARAGGAARAPGSGPPSFGGSTQISGANSVNPREGSKPISVVSPVDRANWTGKKASPLKAIGMEDGTPRKPVRYTAEKWGHGSGGYKTSDLQDALTRLPPPRQPSNVF